LPLDICGAATEGFMGYMIQNTLANCLRQAGAPHAITTVVTEVIVDKNDPAFQNPSKPIGPFYSAGQAECLQREKGWDTIEDSARGYRRIVPSPMPVNIQQSRIIRSMLDAGEIVIAVGGGGIPVVREDNHDLRGVEAVIDKDYASARLALEELSLAEAKELLKEGHFGKGSMEPKIRAAVMFLEETNKDPSREREVIITLPETAMKALEGKTGTRITRQE